MEKGSIIDYQLKIHGVPCKWKTLIEDYQNSNPENFQFIDSQLKGPYNSWRHIHTFLPFNEGSLIVDEVFFRLPFGPLGEIFAGKWVKKDVNNIFSYRKEVIKKIF